jgi:hypothetical protein
MLILEQDDGEDADLICCEQHPVCHKSGVRFSLLTSGPGDALRSVRFASALDRLEALTRIVVSCARADSERLVFVFRRDGWTPFWCPMLSIAGSSPSLWRYKSRIAKPPDKMAIALIQLPRARKVTTRQFPAAERPVLPLNHNTTAREQATKL